MTDSPMPPHPAPDASEPRDQDAQIAAAKQFIEAIPHAMALGLEFERITPGQVRLGMNYDKRFVGDPRSGVIHGGVVSALLDTASGAAVLSHPSGPVVTATIDLRIDYMRPATPGQRLTAEAECYHVTRSVAFVRARAMDEDEGRPVATATGAFTFERATTSGDKRDG